MKPDIPLNDQRFPYTPSSAMQGNPEYLKEKFRLIREQLEARAEVKHEEKK